MSDPGLRLRIFLRCEYSIIATRRCDARRFLDHWLFYTTGLNFIAPGRAC